MIPSTRTPNSLPRKKTGFLRRGLAMAARKETNGPLPSCCLDVFKLTPNETLEGVGIGEDGSEETILILEPNSSFREIAILCNIPQPYTVRVCELCRLLRIDKQLFSNILQIYFVDGRTVLSNLVEGNESNVCIKQLESDITFHIGKQEAELVLRVNSAVFNGDLNHLKGLIRAGAAPRKLIMMDALHCTLQHQEGMKISLYSSFKKALTSMPLINSGIPHY